MLQVGYSAQPQSLLSCCWEPEEDAQVWKLILAENEKKSGRPHQLDQEATLELHMEHQVWSCSVFQRIPRQREEKKIKVKVGVGLEFTLIKGHLKTHCNPDKPRMLGRSLLSSHVVRPWIRKRQSHRQGVGARGFLGWECSTVCWVPMDPCTWSRWEASKGKTSPMCLGSVRWTQIFCITADGSLREVIAYGEQCQICDLQRRFSFRTRE